MNTLVLDVEWQHAGNRHCARLLLDQTPLSIGRDPANLWVLSDSSVSRQHAEILLTPQGPVIRDKQSRFGTQVDHQPVHAGQSRLLSSSCELYLGRQQVLLRYELRPATADFAAAALQELQGQLQDFHQHSLAALQQSAQTPAIVQALQTELSQRYGALAQASALWAGQTLMLQQLHGLVNQTSGATPLLERAVPLIGDLLQAQAGFVLCYDRREHKYQLQACWRYSVNPAAALAVGNSAGADVIACPRQQLAINSFELQQLQWLQADDLQVMDSPLAAAGITAQLALPLQHDGETLAVLYLESRQPGGFCGISHAFCQALQTQLAQALHNAQCLSRALSDDLTGLCSRSILEEQITLAMEQAKRYQQPCCLIFIDLDDFKQINDLYGHFAGDEVLKATAHQLKQLVRKADKAGRLGGEEFVVLVNNTREEGAMAYAERIRADIAAMRLQVDGQPLTITASIGVAAYYPSLHNQAYRFIDCADQAMYQAKHSGKNRVALYQAPKLQLLETAADLRRSVAGG